MALTISIEGKGVIANCDALTNDTGGSGTDDWLELGGGAISDEADAFIYGTTSIGMKYASKSGWTYYQMGTPLDFDTGGTEEGQMIYIWLNIAAPNAFDSLANKGFALRMGNSTTVYREWIIAGEDDANGWAGGWKLFVLDPTKIGSVTDTGTFDVGAVDFVGIWIDTNSSVRADSIFIDQIAVGSGLRITGTWDNTTYPGGAWDEVLAYCTDYTNRAWGMLQERDGILYGFGKFYIGGAVDGDGTARNQVTSFEDAGKVLQFGTSQYYISSAWASTMPTDACGIILEDTASYATDFIDGVIVGSDNGRSGSVYIGNDDQDVIMDLFGGNNVASDTLCYGTTFKEITGAFNSGNDADHKFLGCAFLKCGQFDPVGAPVIRNCTFAEVAPISGSHSAALLWNANIDIQNCSFIANNDPDGTYVGHGIEHSVAATTTYTDLIFSGNEKDVWFSASTGNLSASKSGTSNPATYTNDSTGTVTFPGSVPITITVVDQSNTAITTANVRIEETDGTLVSQGNVNGSGIYSSSFAGTTPLTISLVVRSSSSGETRYFPARTGGTIASSTGLVTTVTLIEDSVAGS